MFIYYLLVVWGVAAVITAVLALYAPRTSKPLRTGTGRHARPEADPVTVAVLRTRIGEERRRAEQATGRHALRASDSRTGITPLAVEA